MHSSGRTHAIVVALAVTVACLPGAAAAAEAPREGTCDGAEELFPDDNPGPGRSRRSRFPSRRTSGATSGAATSPLRWERRSSGTCRWAATACRPARRATSAAAPIRVPINQVNPGGQDNPDPTIDLGGPNHRLRASDFPLHELADPTDRTSAVLRASTTSSRRRACTCGSSSARNGARAATRPSRCPTRCSTSAASTRVARSRATRRR